MFSHRKANSNYFFTCKKVWHFSVPYHTPYLPEQAEMWQMDNASKRNGWPSESDLGRMVISPIKKECYQFTHLCGRFIIWNLKHVWKRGMRRVQTTFQVDLHIRISECFHPIQAEWHLFQTSHLSRVNYSRAGNYYSPQSVWSQQKCLQVISFLLIPCSYMLETCDHSEACCMLAKYQQVNSK